MVATHRTIRQVITSTPTIEGAGVHLKRAFGFRGVSAFDPFLLMDDFRSNDPRQYLKGFPWHPHRGIETITYVLRGTVEHGDSLGNSGVIGAGDVQWMTAGSGIIHQEMPKGDGTGRMWGFQLWANLPAAQKMMPPRYREVQSHQIPVVSTGNGVTIRVICGNVQGTQGPVRDVIIDPEYLDVTVPPGSVYMHPTHPEHTVFAYVIEGTVRFGPESDLIASHAARERPLAIEDNPLLTNESLVLFDAGDHVVVTTAAEPARFLLISGKPIGESVAWSGPIVMNTRDELQVAFEEYRNGTFLKH